MYPHGGRPWHMGTGAGVAQLFQSEGTKKMTVRPIVQFPDPRLRAVAEPVIRFDDDLRLLAADLLETLRAAPGIGITAPHIGVAKRLVVLELSADDGVRTYVNPRVIWVSPEVLKYREGSVSMPGVAEEVERAARVRVSYQDLEGTERTEEADGLLAICLQHEIDQLDGIFWLQRLSRLKRERVIRKSAKRRSVVSGT
jgi:peptide deformylase